MRKSTLILSILLTGVILALVFRLVSTYRKGTETAVSKDSTQVQEQTQSPQSEQLTPIPADIPTAANVQIYEAAVIAAKVLGHNDVYITEYAQLNGADVYLVTFLSGDLVYVSLDGKVISASKQSPIKPFEPTSHR